MSVPPSPEHSQHGGSGYPSPMSSPSRGNQRGGSLRGSLEYSREALFPELLVLQPSAIVDHIAVSSRIEEHVEGEIGGSRPISLQQLKQTLAGLGEWSTKIGGSATNVCSGLAHGFEVNAGVIGAYGDDEMGDFFEAAMKRNKVNTTYMIRKEGRQTGRCLCLVHPKTGQRTMRPAFDENCRLLAKEIPEEAFKGTVVKNVWMRKWVILNAYACYGEDELLERALDTAEMQKAHVCFHLSSFELVRKFKDKRISECLRRECVKIVMGNEDEVTEYGNGDFEKGLELLIASVDIVVATLGERGLVALERNRQSGEIRRIEQRAFTPPMKIIDTTGAGDALTSGFMYGILRGKTLERCCEIGCLTGAAVCTVFGAEIDETGWTFVYDRMFTLGERDLSGFTKRNDSAIAKLARGSAKAVRSELLECFELIEKWKRGIVYYGSARLKPETEIYKQSKDLSRRLAELLGDVTTWTGGGPGMMEAASLGAKEAGKIVGGIRIAREAGTSVKSTKQSYLDPDKEVYCRYLAPRKVALTDAGVRKTKEDKTAYIFLPGGLGSMDEFFELYTLVQLKKLGSEHKVPIILVNYDGFYDCLLTFIKTMIEQGTVGENDITFITCLNTNDEVVDFLKSFYSL